MGCDIVPGTSLRNGDTDGMCGCDDDGDTGAVDAALGTWEAATFEPTGALLSTWGRDAEEIYAVGWIQDDETIKGGTGWGVELAKVFNRPVHVFVLAPTEGWWADVRSLREQWRAARSGTAPKSAPPSVWVSTT